jgi:hypothetical protein
VQVSPGGKQTLFAHITRSDLTGRCPGGVGLTTALEVLRGGWVVVGSTSSKNGGRSHREGRLPDRAVLGARGPASGTVRRACHDTPTSAF